jgi:uncharacterized protein YcnI
MSTFPLAGYDSAADHHTPAQHRAGSRRRRAVLAAGAAAGLLVFSAATASAHVRVIPESTTAGGFAALTFRVPTESDTAGTVALRVELPTDTPFTSVRTRSMPGWTAVVERDSLPEPVQRDGATITEAPTAVVWTADRGTQVAPGQFEEFAISVGPLPEEGTEVVLPATQTYSDGKVVKWAQEPPADGSEPELPAPALVTTESGDAANAHANSTGAAQVQTAADTTTSSSAETSAATDTGARWLGGAGLVLGAAALITVLLRRRPRATHQAG